MWRPTLIAATMSDQAAPGDRGTPGEELDLRKIDREYDRKEAQAISAHDRELDKLRQEHANTLAVNEATADAALRSERIKASAAAEDELNKLFHEKVAEVAVAGVERARDSAKFVQTAATAIFAVYTGLLALVYSVTDNPLPLRGAWAGVFLGLSIAFATAYLAFLTNIPPVKMTVDTRSPIHKQYTRTANLTSWIKASVHRRTYATRASVISLLFGVLFIAAPFVSTAVPAPEISSPSAPAPPAEVDDAFASVALELFESQVEDYQNAVAARAAELAAAEDAAKQRADQEAELNATVTALAVLALMVVLLGPLLYAGLERVARRANTSTHPTDSAN